MSENEIGEQKLSLLEKFERWYLTKYKLWSLLGIVVVAFGLAIMIVRDINEPNLTHLLLTGVETGDVYEKAATPDVLVGHSVEQIMLLAMSLLKLGIGGAIFIIVQNLKATGMGVMQAFGSAGIKSPKMKAPFFEKLFPILLTVGTDVQLVNVLIIMTFWNVNALNLLDLTADGVTGPAVEQAKFIDGLLGTFIVPIEFFGASLMLTAIPLGLATIVFHLRGQLHLMPMMIQEFLTKKLRFKLAFPISKISKLSIETMKKMLVPKGLVMVTLIALLIGISGLVIFSPFRTANFYSLANSPTTAAKLIDSVMSITVEQFIFIGLGLMILAINFWLFNITKGLRGFRQFQTDLRSTISDGKRRLIDKPLWTTKLGLVFAVIGFLFMIANFISAVLFDFNQATVLKLEDAGEKSSAAYQTAILNTITFSILAKYLKFVSFGFLISGVALQLVTIIINLRLTALGLPTALGNLLSFVSSKGRKIKLEDAAVPNPMSLAPWKLVSVIFMGAIIAVSSLIPFGILELTTNLDLKKLELAEQTASDEYQSRFLATRLWSDTLLPYKIAGMGLMLFGVGLTFATIVGFVKARRQIIAEGIDSLVTYGKVRVKG